MRPGATKRPPVASFTVRHEALEKTGERQQDGDRQGHEAETAPLKSDPVLISEILLEGGVGKKQEAYRILVERYWKIVIVTLKTRLPTGTDTEGLAQEVFIRAFRSLEKLTNPKAFAGWLLRITQNLATDQLRKHIRSRSVESYDPSVLENHPAASQATEGIESRVEIQDELEKVMNAIAKLPERYQAVLTLRYLKGLSNREIAGHLAEPDGTIRNRLFRALDKLRNLLKKTPTGNRRTGARESKTRNLQ